MQEEAAMKVLPGTLGEAFLPKRRRPRYRRQWLFRGLSAVRKPFRLGMAELPGVEPPRSGTKIPGNRCGGLTDRMQALCLVKTSNKCFYCVYFSSEPTRDALRRTCS